MKNFIKKSNRVMGAGYHSKNTANPKSLMSRGNILKVKKVIVPFLLCLIMLAITTCDKEKEGGKGQLNGKTFVPKNDVAYSMSYQKFVFSGSKVKVYLGMCGIPMGSFEYDYTLKGNILTIKEGTAGVDLTYDSANDEISILAGFLETEGAVWYNEEKRDKYNFCSEPSCFGDYEIPAPVVSAPSRVDPGSPFKISWPISCAPKYKIDCFFYGNDDKLKYKRDDLEWSGKNEYIFEAPNECGYFNFFVKAKDDHTEGSSAVVTVEVTTKGKLVFLTHGLNDNGTCFEQTVKSLALVKNRYHDYGLVSASYVTKAQYVNQLTDEGKNVLVRLEFSAGNLSFEDQLKEMEKMVAIFSDQNADVVFIGHSMGGLASINYGIKYANAHQSRNIKIITVSTPYHPNNWAKIAWFNDESNNLIGSLINIFAQQNVGEAHRDLGGVGNALINLQNTWNNFTRSNNGSSTKLHAICVSMYAKWDENNKTNTEEHWSDKGDGVVDIPSQEGVGWHNVIQTKTIFGFGKGHTTPLGDLQDTSNSYHHVNTPKLSDVIKQIREIIEAYGE